MHGVVGGNKQSRLMPVSVALCLIAMIVVSRQPAGAIDVQLSIEEAKKALEAGRAPMEKASTPEDVKKVL